MEIILVAVLFALAFYSIIAPIKSAQDQVARYNFNNSYRNLKLKWVRRYYSDLNHLNYEQIADRYNVSDAYNRIQFSRRFDQF